MEKCEESPKREGRVYRLMEWPVQVVSKVVLVKYGSKLFLPWPSKSLQSKVLVAAIV